MQRRPYGNSCRIFDRVIPSRKRSLQERTGVIDKYRRLLGRMLEMVQLEGGLTKTGNDWTIARPLRDQELVSRQSETVRRYPGLTHECKILQNCANILGDTMTGKCNPMEVLFPQGELSSLERLYEDAMMAMLPNRLLRSAFNAILAQLPQDRTLRILELGAGTGGTTAHIVKDLPVDRIDYVYTDISNHFLDKAKEKFRKYPFLRYELLDIEQDPERLGFSPHQFDVVFASNVLHATIDLTRSVGNALSLIAQGGLMFLIEGVRPTGWIDLIFGQLDGWWRFADTDLRPSYPLLSIEKWKRLLEQLGCTAACGGYGRFTCRRDIRAGGYRGQSASGESTIRKRKRITRQCAGIKRRFLSFFATGAAWRHLLPNLCATGVKDAFW